MSDDRDVLGELRAGCRPRRAQDRRPRDARRDPPPAGRRPVVVRRLDHIGQPATAAARRSRRGVRRPARLRGDRAVGSRLADPGQGPAPRRTAPIDESFWWERRHDRARAPVDARRRSRHHRLSLRARRERPACRRSWSIATTARSSSSCTPRSGSPTSPTWSTTLCRGARPGAGRAAALARNVAKGETFGLADGDDDRRAATRRAGAVPRARSHAGGRRGPRPEDRALPRPARQPGAGAVDVAAARACSTCSPAPAASRSPPRPAARRASHLVDVSGPALRTAERNLAHNRFIAAVRDCTVHTTTGDAFVEMDRARGRREQRFDLVVLDPPSFARTQTRRRPNALRAYARLTRLGGRAARAGRRARAVVVLEPRDRRRVLRRRCTRRRATPGVSCSEIRRTGHPLDHPIGFAHGAYLKTLFATRLNRASGEGVVARRTPWGRGTGGSAARSGRAGR